MSNADAELQKSIMDKLMSIKDQPRHVSAGLTQTEVIYLCTNVRQIYLEQPVLLYLHPPLTICGDVHGQYHDLLRLLEMGDYPPQTTYLFLGDYVDRGKQSIETICLLFLLKIQYPEKVFMLRGNHECSYINRIYGFYEECTQFFSTNIWKTFGEVFNCLPISAIIDNKIFCIHGGISPHLTSLDDIKNIQRPVEVPESGLLCDLLWSDPNPDIDTWEENDRGTSVCFGLDPVSEFLDKFGFDLLCRAHQAVMNGYEFPFYPSQNVVTLFSAPNYCYEFENKGAILNVDENLFCSFIPIDPIISTEADEIYVPSRPGTPPRSSPNDESDYQGFSAIA